MRKWETTGSRRSSRNLWMVLLVVAENAWVDQKRLHDESNNERERWNPTLYGSSHKTEEDREATRASCIQIFVAIPRKNVSELVTGCVRSWWFPLCLYGLCCFFSSFVWVFVLPFILPFGWGMIAIAATVMNAVDRRSVMSCCWSFILCCVFHLRNSGVRYEGFKDGHTREPIYRGHRTKVSYPPDVFVFGFAHSLLASFACTRT